MSNDVAPLLLQWCALEAHAWWHAGKGVSSSAALEVSVMQALNATLNLELDGMEIAKLCQKVYPPLATVTNLSVVPADFVTLNALTSDRCCACLVHLQPRWRITL